ncbi:hypothetical protein KCH_59400 [Kitasatospora cheerisanensis KCTC 2395]|uniref:Uncharacterized protein n=1 Tax=Kitasatospora cheerisanensis KCTC 2395 TaxID=1348663 RepID=A0A066YVY0_9ACTN|nr:hypothetical protein KCH_59400 [Kitasatospora cheerisanensis KCTC 2395]
MAVHVVQAGLRVVLDHEDRGVLPVRAVADLVDDLPDRQVVVGDLGGRVGGAAGVVAGQPQHVEVGGAVPLEVLLPDLRPVDVRHAGVELREGRHRHAVQRGDRRGGDQLVRGAAAGGLHGLGVAVQVLPGRAGRLGEELVELAEVPHGLPGRLGAAPQGAAGLVAERVVLGVVAADVLAGRGLGVLRIVGLHQPVVALGGVGADVVRVVVQAELPGQRVLVGRHVLAELGQRRVAVALRQVAEDLVVGAVLLDDQEDVLDRRRVADPVRDGHGLVLLAGGGLGGVVGPVVLREHLAGLLPDHLVAGQGEAHHAGGGVVGGVAGRGGRAERVDAAGVGDQDLVAGGGDLRREVVGGQQADVARRLLRARVPVDGDRVGPAEGDQQAAVVGEGHRVGLVADRRLGPRLGGDGLDDPVLGGVDHRDAVGGGVGDEHRAVLGVHGGRVQADVDGGGRGGRVRRVDHADRAGGGGAGLRVGRHLGAVRVDGALAGLRRAAALVADVQLAAGLGQAARGVADRPALPDRPGGGVDRHHAVLAVDRRVGGRAVGGEDQAGHQRLLRADLGDLDGLRVGDAAVRVHVEPGPAVGLAEPQLPAVGGVRRAFLAHAVAADLRDGGGGGADDLLHLPVLHVHDRQRRAAVGDRGRQVGAVRADHGGHDLALVDHQPLAVRGDVLVAGDQFAPVVDLADQVGAERVGLREADARAGRQDDRGGGGGDQGPASAPAACRARAGKSGDTLPVTDTTTCDLHAAHPFDGSGSSPTLPSNCQSGFGASPVGVRTRK